MATVNLNTFDNYTLGAADAVFLPPGPTTGPARTRVIGLTSASFSGTITVKMRKAGTSDTPVACVYKKRVLNGAAGDETYVSTGITGTSIITIPTEGVQIVLDCGAYTSGSMVITQSEHSG